MQDYFKNIFDLGVIINITFEKNQIPPAINMKSGVPVAATNPVINIKFINMKLPRIVVNKNFKILLIIMFCILIV